MSSYHDQNFRTSKTSYKLSLYHFIASETLSNSLKQLIIKKIAKKRNFPGNSGVNSISIVYYTLSSTKMPKILPKKSTYVD